MNLAIITHCFLQKYVSRELYSRKPQLFLFIFSFSAKRHVNIFYTILYLPFQATLLTRDFFYTHFGDVFPQRMLFKNIANEHSVRQKTYLRERPLNPYGEQDN